ncbi:phage portal protein [Aeromonas hydrophila]
MFNLPKKKSYSTYSSGSFQLDIPIITSEVLNEPTVLACLGFISGSVIGMPLKVKGKDGHYYDKYSSILSPELNVILKKPNTNETTSQFLAKVVGQLVLHNECFIQVRKGSIGTTGKVQFIECLEAGKVERHQTTTGRVEYIGRDNYGNAVIQDEIHYLTTTRVGFSTLNPLAQIKQIIDLANNSISHAKEFYSTAPRNSGWFTSEQEITDEQYTRLKEQINEQAKQSGYGLIEGVTFTPNTYNFKDAMNIETRKSTSTDICTVMGIHPALLGFEWAASTDIDSLRTIFLSTKINPLVLAIEEFYLSIGFDVDLEESGLLNASYIERSRLAMEQYKLGLLSRNEARVDLPELLVGGDEFVVDSNNLTMGNLNTDNNNNKEV